MKTIPARRADRVSRSDRLHYAVVCIKKDSSGCALRMIRNVNVIPHDVSF